MGLRGFGLATVETHSLLQRLQMHMLWRTLVQSPEYRLFREVQTHADEE